MADRSFTQFKGVGEIGVVRVAPAIGNAVFYATAQRIRGCRTGLDVIDGSVLRRHSERQALAESVQNATPG